MEKNLFRKVSIERLSSPEQLDKLLVIVRIKGWIALLTLLGITLAILVWAFLGHIPIAANGKGILLDPRGLHGVFSRSEGRVMQVPARTGVEVVKGEVLVVMENQLLVQKLQALNEEIASLQKNVEKEKALLEEQQKVKEEEMRRKEALEKSIIENQKAKLALLEKELETALGEKKVDLEKEIFDQRILIESRLSAMQIFHSEAQLTTTHRTIDALESSLQSKIHERELTRSEVENLVIRAPEGGRIIEIDVMLEREVIAGTPLVWIQANVDREKVLPFYTFVPVNEGEKIKPGMPAHIDLLAIDAQKYGQIKGRVLRVLPYATSLSAQQLAGIPSSVLREYLSADPTSILVVIQPIADPSTPTGYAWTSGQGPSDEEIFPGAIGEARIILESKRPITYVLPILTER